MCRQRELMERLKILEESGMISSRVSAFCMDAAEIILGEKEDADGEKLSMLITHLAMAGGGAGFKGRKSAASVRNLLHGAGDRCGGAGPCSADRLPAHRVQHHAAFGTGRGLPKVIFNHNQFLVLERGMHHGFNQCRLSRS